MAESLAALVKRVNALTTRVAGSEGRLNTLEAAPAPIPPDPVPTPTPVPVPVPTPTPSGAPVKIEVPPIQLGSPASLWVRVFGGPSFDAAKIDPASVTLGDGAGKDVRATQWEIGNDYSGDAVRDAQFAFPIPQLQAVGAVTSSASRLVWRGSTPAGSFSGTSDAGALPIPTPIPTPVPVPVPVPPLPVTPPAGPDLIVYPRAEVALVCGPQLKLGSALNPWPWFDSNAVARGLVHGALFPANPADMDHDEYLNRNYYDQGLAQYINYYRTGDSRFLTYARKINDSWWLSPLIGGGTVNPESSLTPRSSSLGGLMLRALDGRPEMWPWITDFVRFQYQIWIGAHLNSELNNGVRDGGFVLLFTAWLAQVHPDAAVRAEMQTKALAAAVEHYARLQAPDGGWYWGGEGTPSPEPLANKTSQPFMVGILLEGLVATHQATNDATVRQSILKAVDWLWEKAYEQTDVATLPGVRWRAMRYFVFRDQPLTIRTDVSRYGFQDGAMRDERQLNPETIHAFGYAFKLTGDPKYRTRGDEIFAATFGNGQGPGADVYYGLADYREKEWDVSYRSAGRYLAWRQ